MRHSFPVFGHVLQFLADQAINDICQLRIQLDDHPLVFLCHQL